MPADRQKTEALFFAAVELPPGQRSRFLEESCGNDPQLRREVESLLNADESRGPDLLASVESAARDLLGGDPLLGARLGTWRVVREIGRGGMGVVYLALRDDDQFR